MDKIFTLSLTPYELDLVQDAVADFMDAFREEDEDCPEFKVLSRIYDVIFSLKYNG